jgi:hypothetical protein
MRIIAFCPVVFFVLASASRAADMTMPAAPAFSRDAPVDSGRNAWKRSLLPLVASQALDAGSSWGMREMNPLLADSSGRFGAKAATVKFGAVGAFIGIEYLLMRKYPRAAHVFAKLNWTGAVVTSGFAAHNFAIR